MASLKFIMDVNDDHHQPDNRLPHNKRDKGANKPASAGQVHEAPPSSPQANPRHATRPGLPAEKDINRAAPAPPQTKKRGPSSRGNKSAAATSGAEPSQQGAAAAAVPSPSSSSPSLSAPTSLESPRRRSSTSNDSMDPRGYGSGLPPSQMGGGPQRPMPLHPVVAHLPTPRITPKTGRISKAQKGLPVHVCTQCRPPKTFTRAEHLRRHQLSHGKAQFQCSSCDRAFHRADLLARHQQKHEHDGDGTSKPGSAQQSPLPSPAALALHAQQSPRSSGSAPTPSPLAAEMPATPSPAAGNQARFSQLGGQAHGDGSTFESPKVGSQELRNTYTLSSTLSVINPTPQPSSLAGSSYTGEMVEYEPRTAPPSIYVVTQGLSLPSLQPTELPELHEASAWPSSASDSTYSTPASEISRNPRPWARGHRSPTGDWTNSSRLSPYPNATPRGLQTSGPGTEAVRALQPPLFANSYSNPQPSEQSYGGGAMLNVPSVGFPGATGYRHSSLSSASGSPYPQHSSVRSPSPPTNTASQASETLLASVSAITNRLDPMVGIDRRKAMMMDSHQDLLGAHTSLGAVDVLGGLTVGYAGASSSAASPRVDIADHSSGIVAELDLAMGGGCSLPIPSSMVIPLPGPVRAAIPRYLELYWAYVDPMMPLVHRQSFEAAPEDVLRCAMAAVATQKLDSKEDRTRGNQLHEFAWQEVKRVPQWTLQTMQAILLCEYFARFRGRKAVTRPSKPFESLYSRVLYPNPAFLDHATDTADQHRISLQDRWQKWVDVESRRRLFAACLFSDGHTATYQQQRRVQDFEASASAALQLIPLVGRSTKLWEASSAEEWAAILAADPSAGEPEHAPPVDQLTPDDVMGFHPMDQMIILSICALRLPRRQRSPTTSVSASNSPAPEFSDPHTVQQHFGGQFSPDHHLPTHHPESIPSSPDQESLFANLFLGCPIANTYLALHHTPLCDLLAVSGDSWIFSKKVLPATSFREHQNRLKLWITAASNGTVPSTGALAGLSATRATVYAARAILGFLGREGRGVGNAAAPWAADLADYWALYVCALICWAFGYRVGGSGGGRGGGEVQYQQQVQQHQQVEQHQQVQQMYARPPSSSGGGGMSGSSAGSSPAPPRGAALSGSAAVPATATATATTTTATSADEEAIAWLRAIAAEGMRLEDVVRLVRAESAGLGVVSLVRRRLENDCLGGRSRLYVDAVGVLRKLEEGVGRRLF